MADSNITSCLMLMTTLYLPLDLDCLIDDSDLKEGIKYDYHITISYKIGAPILDRKKILPDMKNILGDLENNIFLEFLKKGNLYDVSKYFDLSCFDNEEDYYLILKLKSDNEVYNKLSILNKGFTKKYKIKSNFSTYTPHITLAGLKPDCGDKYLTDRTLSTVLKASKLSFDDFTLSYGVEGKQDFRQYCITTNRAAERHIREERRVKESKLKP